jgi:MraZ protein
MLLTGTYPRTLDDKHRLALPKRVRELLQNPGLLYLTPGPDGCLWVYTQEGLDRLAQKLEQAPATGNDVRVFQRLYFARSEAVPVDRLGRILIPERALQMAGLKQDLVLIGVRDHLELWDAARWQQYLDQHAPHFDTVAEGAFRA